MYKTKIDIKTHLHSSYSGPLPKCTQAFVNAQGTSGGPENVEADMTINLIWRKLQKQGKDCSMHQW